MITFSFAQTAQEKRQCVVNCAHEQLGKPYVWGANGPNSFDCSGLVMYCYNKCIQNFFPSRPTTKTIRPMGTEVAKKEDLKLGDIIFPSDSHVCIYIGVDKNIQKMIHAPQENDVVKISTIYAWVTARRLIPDDEVKPNTNNNNNNNGTNNSTNTNSNDTTNIIYPKTSEERRKCIVEKAKQQLGKGYGYGDEGPDKFDCSGLVMYVYNLCIQNFFVERPTTSSMKPMGKLVEKPADLKPGDIIYPRDGHTSIYIGIIDGEQKMVDIEKDGVVSIIKVDKWLMGRRFIEDDVNKSTSDVLSIKITMYLSILIFMIIFF